MLVESDFFHHQAMTQIQGVLKKFCQGVNCSDEFLRAAGK